MMGRLRQTARSEYAVDRQLKTRSNFGADETIVKEYIDIFDEDFDSDDVIVGGQTSSKDIR